MPEIHINKEDLENDLGKGHIINTLHAYMAWPDKEEERSKLIHLSETIKVSKLLDEAVRKRGAIDAAEVKELFQLAWDCPPISKEDDATIQRIDKGLYLAGALNQTLGDAYINNKKVSLWGNENGVFRDRVGKKLGKGQSIQNIKRMWHKMRPVAHLFLARQFLSNLDPKLQMPCDVNTLEKFIAYAEAFRKIGEAYKPIRSKEPLIPPNKSFKIIMDGYVIPNVSIEWAIKPTT
jgi:hypothetical protein